ncbi:probable sporulation protein, polysaccharide deacetylase family [Geosporobacter subterraneus DSM 17957]|uniref:Probable sporulation protein, polysaccharide deacetylase family n=1 Tax=Geosporobacter subterraneus DSM 17957 TaxID=1121919 RepID=A0A1M6DZR5_9FIRM|nr:polysaccharide deacetylase family protein [Geosporobacter subterraneus]SHI78752.1 probable sporulation protein, polysaccharide deacetylase family [Geosporobacter subterraneus DSM 17957]
MRIIILKRKYILVAAGAILLILLGFISFLRDDITVLQRYLLHEPIRSGDPSLNKAAITCNVDWGNEIIPEILDVLDDKNIKITFFVTGRWASKYPELLQEMFNRGHEIGNHGYSHKTHSKMNKKDNFLEIKKAEEAIEKVLGVKPKYFAPPSGDYSEATLEAAEKLGYQTILWSIDTIDWQEGSTADVIISRVMKKSHNGAILLMHPKRETAKALPIIIDRIIEEGIQLGTVSNLLE